VARVICGIAAVVGAVFGLAACGGGSSSGTVTLNWWAGNQPGGSFQQAAAYCSKQSGGKYTIKVNLLGTDADSQRQSLVRRLAAGDSSIDLMAMDVVWTAEFAEAKWILPFPADKANELKQGRLAGPLKTATYQGKLWAAPGNSNTQLLWYRKSQVKGDVPTTWSQLISDAEKLHTTVAYTGAQYEGMTVWFNSLIQSAGGNILDGPNKVGLNKGAVQAINLLHQFAASPAANGSLPAAKEDQARQAFEVPTGTAFELNYPFVYASAQSNTTIKGLKDDIAWAPYPSVTPGGPAKPPIGGFNWGVGAHTKHPALAFDAATCLASEQPERLYAQLDALPPTLSKVYDDPKFKKSYPFADLVRKQIDQAGVRPVTPLYSDVSLAVYSTLSPASKIKTGGNATLNQLRDRLSNALQSKGLL
jgi:multiple sugar transport system substrate-binding protein